MWRTSLLALALLACGQEEGPAPSLIADVRALRAVIADDPTGPQIEEAELEAAGRRPVRAGDLVESTVLPLARAQAQRARAAEVTTGEGRAFRRRLARAYDERVRGLAIWRRYLAGAATDDALLLDATTHQRNAEVQILAVDRDMDAVTPE